MENNLLENLNKEQLEAVMHKEGPLLIIAGAGTGKTTVISQRIAYLIEQGLAKPEEILALTFTEKAAGEMEERVDRLVPLGYLDLWISTFHSFGEKILKAHGLDIGLADDFKLLNEFEQWAIIRKNLDKFGLDYYRPAGNPTKFIRGLVHHFSRAKDEDISPAEYLQYANELKENLDSMLAGSKKRNTREAARGRKVLNLANTSGEIDKEIAEQEVLRINEIANAYHVYQQLLFDSEALDFGDLINFTLKLFRTRPKILNQYRQQFKYILIDEFQDTNWAQYELIKLLAAPRNNVVVVGDDDQSIYKFRGASVANILQFRRDYSRAKEVVLIKNYRNSQNILDLAYNFIQLNNPNRLECQAGDKKGKKVHKKLIAQQKGAGQIEVIEGGDLADEIKEVVVKLAEIKAKDKTSTFGDFAILVRANESAKEVCNFLEQAGLPYQFVASRGLYARPLIMDIIAYFKLLDDYHENSAMYRILNISVLGFTYQELVNINYQANKKAWSLYEVLKNVASLKLGEETQNKSAVLLGLIEKHSSLARTKNTSELMLVFLEDSGYLKHITSKDDRASREAAGLLNQFMKRIQLFESRADDRTVKEFLREFNLEIEAGEQGSLAPDAEAGPETIKVMTMHAAKGLEFKYVFLTNMVDKRFPTISRSEPIPLPEALVKEILPEGDIHLQEERRLFYVAITRAKKGIYFSWAPDYGGTREKKPSRFLLEAKLIGSQPAKKKRAKVEKITRVILPAATDEARINPAAPKYFSYSQLAAFSNCPYQYRFAHILRIPRRGKPQFSFGKTMHQVMQKLFELANEKRGIGQGNLFAGAGKEKLAAGQAIISLEEVMALYTDSWIDDWYQSKQQKKEYLDMGKRMLTDFYEKHKENWPAPLFLERSFNFKVKANGNYYSIRGVIDRVDAPDGKLKIVDYKTGAPKEKLTFKDKEQLLLYQLAAQDVFADKELESLSFYYLENNKEVNFLGTDAELDKVYQKTIDTIEAIRKGKFPPKPGTLCRYCDFNLICEYRKI